MNQTECNEKAVWLEMLTLLTDKELKKILGVWDREALASILTKGWITFYNEYITAIVLKKMGVTEIIPGKLWMKVKS